MREEQDKTRNHWLDCLIAKVLTKVHQTQQHYKGLINICTVGEVDTW